jgi:hypothetical protein
VIGHVAARTRTLRASPLIDLGGSGAALVARMRRPVLKALAGRQCFYVVRVEALGPAGDVLVSITGSAGRVLLVFGPGELEPRHVSSVVRRAVDRAAL